MADNSPEKTPLVWEGVYQTWGEALAAGEGFSGKRWLDRIVQQLEDYSIDRKKYGNLALPPRPSSLPMLCSLTKSDSIVDFGGSSGWAWYYLKECIDDLLVKRYDIVEIGEICQHFTNSNYHDNQPIHYFTSDEYEGNCDILYTNSALQYIEDDEIFFRLIEGTKPKYLLVEDFLGGAFDNFYSRQIYYDSRIPVKFRNQRNFVSNLLDLSFELQLSKDYITSIRGRIQQFPMSNMPEDKRLRFGQTLLFTKVNQ